jgi:hypothetical protein
MTNAEFTGLTALPEQPRTVSVRYSNDVVAGDISEAFVPAGSGTGVVEGFQSGADQIVLPEGTDLSQVTVSAEWQGNAWGLTIRTAAEGDADVFLRWGWEFKPETDLAVGGATDPVAPEAPAEPAPIEAGAEETPVVEAPVVETPVVETPVVESPVVEAPVAPQPVASGGSTEGYTPCPRR